jgi:hypothetical protein
MKKLALVLTLAPALALAQASGAAAPPPGKGPPPGRAQGAGAPPDDATRLQRQQKRMRLAATLGLAEALDLDDAGALRVRDVLARYGEKRQPIQRQIRDSVRTLRDAAQGDTAAGAQVDAALKRLQDARAQRQALDQEMLQQLTQGLSPDKKARAALFLARFRERASRMAMRGGPGGWHGGSGGMGPGHMGPGGMGPGGMGPGRPHAMMDDDAGPGPRGPGAMRPGGPATAMTDLGQEPELDAWFDE